MVETVAGQPVTKGQPASAATFKLSPGTEVRAKVAENLPGPIVRLETPNGNVDVRVPAPLKPGGEFLLSVSGTTARPEIALTALPSTQTANGQPGGAQNPSGQASILPQTSAASSGETLPAVRPGGSPPSPAALSPAQTGPGAPSGANPAIAPSATVSSSGTVRPSAPNSQPAPSGNIVSGGGSNPARIAGTPQPVPLGQAPSGSAVAGPQAAPGNPAAQAGGAPTLPGGAEHALPSRLQVQSIQGQTPTQNLVSPSPQHQGAPVHPASGNPLPSPSGGIESPVLKGQGGGVPVSGQSGSAPGIGNARPVLPETTRPSAVSPQVPTRGQPASGGGALSASGAIHSETVTSAPQGNSGPGKGTVSGPAALSGYQRGPGLHSEATVGLAGRGSSAPGARASSGQSAQPVQQAADILRGPLLEQQTGLGALFARIGAVLSHQGSEGADVPDELQKVMRQILGLRLNAASGATGKGLATAARLSGTLREAVLASGAPIGQQGLSGQSGPGVPADLKSALLSLRSLLIDFGVVPKPGKPFNQPPEPSLRGAPQAQPPQALPALLGAAPDEIFASLLKDTDAALARIRLIQMSNAGLSRDEGGSPVSARLMDTVVEMPLHVGQETAVLQMQIGRDPEDETPDRDSGPSWRLRFALDLTATGALEAAATLRGGGTFVSLWIERPETMEAFSASQETIQAAFAEAGLNLQELRFMRGLPPKAAARYGAVVDRRS